MKKNNLPGKCQKRFTAIFVSVMIFSLISGTVSAAETEMTKQSTESEKQTSEAEPFQSSTELPVEEETEAPVEVPTEAITEAPVEAPTEAITEAPVEAPTEAITEAPVETPTEVITEDFVAVPNENETEMKEPNGDENETSTEPVTEDSTQTPAEMTFDLSARVSLGVNQLKLKDGQQPFVRSLFSEDEIRQGGHGNVLLYADLLDDLLKDEQEKAEEQKLSEEERNSLKAEKAILEQWTESNGYTVEQYFSLRLFRQRNDEEPLKIAESKETLSMIMETTGEQTQSEDRMLVYVKDGQAVICGDADSRGNIIAFDTGTFGTYALVSRSQIPKPDTESAESEDPIVPESDTESEDSIVMELSGLNAVYHPGSRGQWNPDTLCYENATSGQWTYEEGEGKVSFTNKGNEDVTLILSYNPSESHKEITGVFKDQKGETVQKLSISAENTATVYLNLYGEPDPGINGEVIGTVSYEQAG